MLEHPPKSSLASTRHNTPGLLPTRSAAHAALTVILRVGALLLGSGASTNDVESTMLRLSEMAGLRAVEPTVIAGLVSVAWDPGLDGEPITLLRVVRQRLTEYDRLADLAALVRRCESRGFHLEDLDAGLDAIETRVRSYATRQVLLATSASAAASTILFGGGLPDALAAAVATGVAQPLAVRLGATGFPMFFQNVIAPAFATLVAVALIAAHLPINGPVVVTGAILLFLPGAALVAGMRDLIDGENVSGTARLSEALLLGAAVAVGIAAALSVGWLFGVELLLFNLVPPAWREIVEFLAAVCAVGFFAVRGGAPRNAVLTAALLGGFGVATRDAMLHMQPNGVLATGVAAAVIGTLASVTAGRLSSLSTIWVGAASLPLLPGLLIVRGLAAQSPTDALALLGQALATGFAIGTGVAVGEILVATASHFTARARRTRAQSPAPPPAYGR